MKRSLICLSISALIIFLSLVVQADSSQRSQNGEDFDFFDDFEPQDININNEATLRIRSGGTLDVQAGATFILSGAFDVNVAQTDAFTVSDGSGTTFFQVNTSSGEVTAFDLGQGDPVWNLRADDAGPFLSWTDAGGTTVFAADLDATTFTFTTATDSATAFVVEDSTNTAALTVNTSTNSATIGNDLTLGGSSMPVIHVGTGTVLNIFDPNDGVKDNVLAIQGDISVSGEMHVPGLFAPLGVAFANVQSNQANLEKKVKVVASLEKKIARVDADMTAIRKVTGVTPKMLEAARGSSTSDVLLYNEWAASRDFATHGERTYIRRLSNGSEIVSFAQESVQAMVSDVGVAELKDGEAIVQIDPQFRELVRINESTPYYIQLTPKGVSEGLYVEEQTDEYFKVRELNNGQSSISFFWRVEAVRRGLEGAKFIDPKAYKDLRRNPSNQ